MVAAINSSANHVANLVGRVEEYRTDTKGWSRRRYLWADCIPEAKLRELTKARLAKTNSTLPVGYFVATAKHESGLALNERDTEPNGFQSWGLYQISDEEAGHFLMTGEDMLDPANATLVMVGLASSRAQGILHMASLHQDPDALVHQDLPAYLAIAHNMGLGSALESIHNHGLNWSAYRRRNPHLRIVTSGYGDACLNTA